MPKSVDVFMTFYIGDYLKKTTMLSCEEHGAYILLLFSLWQSGGSLPLDSSKLGRICRLSSKKFDVIWKNISCFFEITENQISNKRVLEEMELADQRRIRARVNGSNGGRPPKEKPSGLPSGLPSREPREEAKPNPEKSSSPSPSPSHSYSSSNTEDNTEIQIQKKDKKEKFVVPTIQEVKDHCMEHGYTTFDCAGYLDYRIKTNWEKTNGTKVKNWKNDIHTSVRFNSFQLKSTVPVYDPHNPDHVAKRLADEWMQQNRNNG